jgi:alpha-L-rhamnosidase
VLHYADRRFQTPEGDDTPAGRIAPSSQRTFDTPQGPVSYQTFGQVDEFVSGGEPGEQFCPKFNYHGFRYVIVEGLPAEPVPGDAEALPIESDLTPAGSFSCSNELLNRIHRTNVWTLRCLDLGGYMVDCPHRERLGYGDGQVGIDSLTMNRDTAAFYTKWAGDWLDAQDPSTGEFPHTAPRSGGGGGPGWGGTGCALPWKLWLYYGDRRLLGRCYEPMRRYVEFLDRQSTDGILRAYGGEWDFIGDWLPPGRGMDTSNWPPKPAAELFNNCYRVYLWDMLARSAAALGRPDEVRRCEAKLAELRPLIHGAFYDAGEHRYVLDEQSCQVMPLMAGVVPEELRGALEQRLEDSILLASGGHLDTGMLGTYFLIQFLAETGRDDLLYTIVSQETYPGWGYMLSRGATTFWEQWNGYWSHIHSCFTSPASWFTQGLAGIRPDARSPGFKRVVIRPALVGDLKWVKGSYDSIHGRIVSNWRREGDALTMDVTIPANTAATVYVPTRDARAITEAGGFEGVTLLRVQDGAAVYAVGSGTYRFHSFPR